MTQGASYSPIRTSDNWFADEDKTLQFTIRDSTGTPQNITGWTITWVLRTSIDAGSATLTKTATLSDAANGVCQVLIAAADTSGLAAATYYHALKRTNSGNLQVLAEGEAVLQHQAAQ